MSKTLTGHKSKYDETSFEIPPEGLTAKQRKICLEAFKVYNVNT
jgi:histidine decarboxylase